METVQICVPRRICICVYVCVHIDTYMHTCIYMYIQTFIFDLQILSILPGDEMKSCGIISEQCIYFGRTAQHISEWFATADISGLTFV